MDPHQLLQALRETSLFRQWKEQHPKAECSHFFCRLTAAGGLSSPWDIGFFNPDDGKITVFTEQQNGFEEKPADDVFKAPTDTVEVLLMPLVKTQSDNILARCHELLPQYFPEEKVGEGFVILQTFRGQTIWNISFATAGLKFVNLKFDAQSGEKVAHEVVSLKG